MKYRAVVFDRDGVLAYFDATLIAQKLAPLLPISVGALVLRWDAWGSRYGFPTTLDEEEKSVELFWRDIGGEYDLSADEVDRLLDVDYTSLMRPYPDARPALEFARSQGLKIGVLSNFSLASLDRSLVAVGLNDLVDIACAATAIGASKPAPDAYLGVAERLDVSPSSCLFFDDEVECVNGALRVGMNAYWVNRQMDQGDSPAQDLNILADLSVLPGLVTDEDE